jgi:hypothetical protein
MQSIHSLFILVLIIMVLVIENLFPVWAAEWMTKRK